jgi:DNA recombination protein RmuC
MVPVLIAAALGLVFLVVTGAVVARVLTTQLRNQAAAQAATLASERQSVVQAAVDTVLDLAGDKLGDHMAAGSRELDLRNHAFEQRVGDMATQLHRVTDLVATLQRERAEQHGQLITQITEATRTSERLAETTGHLREALASPKARGQWGERMADDVLTAAGFVEGVNYRKQSSIAGGGIPDFTFLLPRGLLLHMDVKFPVDNYLRHLEADTEAARTTSTAAFLRDVRNRIKELARRDYLTPGETLDELLLFIPNESVYGFIHEHDPALIDVALQQRVVLCSPMTLFAVLAVIRQAADNVRLERTSDEILQCLSGFGQQWLKFSEQLDLVGKRLETAQKGFEDLAGPRRRQLQKKLDEVDELRSRRGLPGAVTGLGDGEGEATRRAEGDIRELPGGRVAG